MTEKPEYSEEILRLSRLISISPERTQLIVQALNTLISPSVEDQLQSVDNNSFDTHKTIRIIEELFLENPLPAESLRDPQVAISVMNVRQSGVDTLGRLVATISSTIATKSEIELIKARTESQVRLNESQAALNESRLRLQESLEDSGVVEVLGRSLKVVDLVDAIENQVPRPMAELFLNSLSSDKFNKSQALGDLPIFEPHFGDDEDEYEDLELTEGGEEDFEYEDDSEDDDSEGPHPY